jgi:hypothetical protein
MPGEVVPFGKYKGQPVEALTADQDYCAWLISQPWFRSRYSNVYNVVITYGGEPQDSPEHNQMQAQFLDDDWCLRLATLLVPDLAGGHGETAARREMEGIAEYQEFRECVRPEVKAATVRNRSFEYGGWDVHFEVSPAVVKAWVISLEPLMPAARCICHCDHDADCKPGASCHGGPDRFPEYCQHRGHDRAKDWGSGAHCTEGCPWARGGRFQERVVNQDGNILTAYPTKAGWLKHGNEHGHSYSVGYLSPFLVELKPDLGDDYPAVLRQVGGYKAASCPYRCVVARRHAFEHVEWDQVKKIFAASGITLLAESAITATSARDGS